MNDKYQVMPALSTDEYDSLKADIQVRGVMVPVEYDENGDILDGYHRVKACTELGIKEWPRITRIGMSEAEKKQHARKLNLARRHLNQHEKRELIEQQLLETPTVSDRQIAAGLGVSNPTVSALRKDLEDSGQLLKVNSSIGADGKERPRAVNRKPIAYRYEDATPQGHRAILEGAKNLKSKNRKHRQDVRAAEKAAAAADNPPLDGHQFKLIHTDISKAEVADESIDAIITDPPYPHEFESCYLELREFAKAKLRPGGHLLVMTGQSNLFQFANQLITGGTPRNELCTHFDAYGGAFCRHCASLRYVWTLAYFTPGESTQVFGRGIKSNWKPVFWLVKGARDWVDVPDTLASDANDKRFHEWGQSVGGMAQLIERFTVPKEVICDPFCGGGATGVAAVMSDRFFIGIDNDISAINTTAKRLQVPEAA